MTNPSRTRARVRRGTKERVSSQSEPDWSDTPAIEDFSDDSDGLVRKISHSKSIQNRKMPMYFEKQRGRPWMHGALPAEEAKPMQQPVKQPAKNQGNLSADDESSLSSVPEESLLDPSLLSLDSLGSSSPAHGTRPPSAIKIGGTPAHETSFLALKKFKRRAREPSVLDRLEKVTRDLEHHMEKKNMEKSKNVAKSHRGTSTPSTGSCGKKRKLPSTQSTHVSQSSPPNVDDSGTSTPSTASTGKKRKLSSPLSQLPQSSPPIVARRGTSTPSRPSPGSKNHFSSPTARDIESSLPGTPEMEPTSPRHALLRRGGSTGPRQVSTTHVSSPITRDPESSPPGIPEKGSTTPKRGRQRRGAPSGPLAVSTTKLQALLPRRRAQTRQRHGSGDELGKSDDDWEVRSPITEAMEGRQTREATAAEEASRTRRPSGGTPDPVLASIAKKFADVDAYDMEFETVDVGGGSSSPWR
ncbi:uncharacterized protein EI97DRAFT_64954 [Westerdykella ornata]|uniref:Uncharacterized protein n=1 Tax=Westerdykella ornata TaxID=318751 RepID=A0A6A6JHB5_WESOR|nr:uncharacterized protein EI97DRAFT_64954 [Westerdykella ornata]KAF2275594.1 hypothetical protein EI97DRAFT_64954 [Westerdykella ornata]